MIESDDAQPMAGRDLENEVASVVIAPLAAAFARWTSDQLGELAPDYVLLLRGAGTLMRVAPARDLTGSVLSIADDGFTLAMAMATEETFENYIELISLEMLNGSLRDVFDRLEIALPSESVLADLNVDIEAFDGDQRVLRRFIRAQRPTILAACRERKRRLFQQLHHHGVRPGAHVAVVAGASDRMALEVIATLLTRHLDTQVTELKFCADGVAGDITSRAYISALLAESCERELTLWRECEMALTSVSDPDRPDEQRPTIRVFPVNDQTPSSLVQNAYAQALKVTACDLDVTDLCAVLSVLTRREIVEAIKYQKKF